MLDIGDQRDPGGPHVHGIAILEGQCLGVTAGDLGGECRTGGRTGEFDPNLETQVRDAVDDGPGDSGALGGTVPVRDRHLRRSTHPNVVRAHQDSVQRGDGAQKRHHERIGRPVVHLGGRADLLDAALVDHRYPVGDIEGLGLVVGDQHRRDMHFVVQSAQPGPQVLADLGVERAERLIEEEHLRIHRQRTGQGHALALAAGQLIGIAGLKTGQAHDLEEPVDLVPDLGLGLLADLETECDVVADGQVLERRVVLEDEPDTAPLGRHVGDVLAVDDDRATVRPVQAGDSPQQRGLA